MASDLSNSPNKGGMLYLSTSEDGKTPAMCVTDLTTLLLAPLLTNHISIYSIIATGAVFSVLPAIAVAFRFYVRYTITHRNVGLDDWLMLASFILTLGLGIMLIAGKTCTPPS